MRSVPEPRRSPAAPAGRRAAAATRPPGQRRRTARRRPPKAVTSRTTSTIAASATRTASRRAALAPLATATRARPRARGLGRRHRGTVSAPGRLDRVRRSRRELRRAGRPSVARSSASAPSSATLQSQAGRARGVGRPGRYDRSVNIPRRAAADPDPALDPARRAAAAAAVRLGASRARSGHVVFLFLVARADRAAARPARARPQPVADPPRLRGRDRVPRRSRRW